MCQIVGVFVCQEKEDIRLSFYAKNIVYRRIFADLT